MDANSSPLILVVDNEPNLCGVVQRILEREGYRVVIAHDGNTAMELIHHSHPDMVVLDMLLPGIDNAEFCRRIREVSTCRIVYFTARAHFSSTRRLCSYKEADGFIGKPASIKRILSVVENTLTRQEIQLRK